MGCRLVSDEVFVPLGAYFGKLYWSEKVYRINPRPKVEVLEAENFYYINFLARFAAFVAELRLEKSAGDIKSNIFLILSLSLNYSLSLALALSLSHLLSHALAFSLSAAATNSCLTFRYNLLASGLDLENGVVVGQNKKNWRNKVRPSLSSFLTLPCWSQNVTL